MTDTVMKFEMNAGVYRTMNIVTAVSSTRLHRNGTTYSTGTAI